MGGPNKSVEIGVISLGTTSQDGKKREVSNVWYFSFTWERAKSIY